MDCSDDPTGQRHVSKHKLFRRRMESGDEADVSNLDDPNLKRECMLAPQHKKPGVVADHVKCRFRANLSNKSDMCSLNIADYGRVESESEDELVAYLPQYQFDRVLLVRQIWVCKYLAPDADCRMIFDVPQREPGRLAQVTIWRVAPKIENDDGAATPDAPTSDPPDGQAALPSKPVRKDIGHFQLRTRRAMSLPLPRVLRQVSLVASDIIAKQDGKLDTPRDIRNTRIAPV